MTAIPLNLRQPVLRSPALRRVALPAALLLLAVLGGWWLLTWDKVEQRVRDEEVEMFDLAVPPPPPPPPPEEVQPEQQVEQVVEQPVQAVQRDPLTPPSPVTNNPPAGDLSSLLQDPTGDAGAFVGGPRGQGGSGSGPMIGGVGKGGQGNPGASRAYAELVQRALMRQLRRRPDLASARFGFRVRVRVSGDGGLQILGVSNVNPADLENDLLQALRGLSRIDTPPPAGVPNQITLQLNQA